MSAGRPERLEFDGRGLLVETTYDLLGVRRKRTRAFRKFGDAYALTQYEAETEIGNIASETDYVVCDGVVLPRRGEARIPNPRGSAYEYRWTLGMHLLTVEGR